MYIVMSATVKALSVWCSVTATACMQSLPYRRLAKHCNSCLRPPVYLLLGIVMDINQVN